MKPINIVLYVLDSTLYTNKSLNWLKILTNHLSKCYDFISNIKGPSGYRISKCYELIKIYRVDICTIISQRKHLDTYSSHYFPIYPSSIPIQNFAKFQQGNSTSYLSSYQVLAFYPFVRKTTTTMHFVVIQLGLRLFSRKRFFC